LDYWLFDHFTITAKAPSSTFLIYSVVFVALTHYILGVRPSGNLRLSKFNPVEFVNGEKIRQVSLSSFRLTYYGTGFLD
jgi:hypothetical protein